MGFPRYDPSQTVRCRLAGVQATNWRAQDLLHRKPCAYFFWYGTANLLLICHTGWVASCVTVAADYPTAP